MRGDAIIVEDHHRRAAAAIVAIVRPKLMATGGRYTISIAGESGSGKSETAVAVAELLASGDIASVIFQQDDYYVHPPKTNDRTRRSDISWVGVNEVRLALLDSHLEAFRGGAANIEKPLVIYEDDKVATETMDIGAARVAIAEGTYTTLLEQTDDRVFLERNHLDTRAHREKRNRDAAELDEFTEKVLRIEHDIISAHKTRAGIIIDKDYNLAGSASEL